MIPKLTPGISRNNRQPAKPPPTDCGAMRAPQPFFGQKPAAGRQNSGVSAKSPSPPQKETHSWKTALRADGIVCPEGRFFCTIWEKRGFCSIPRRHAKKAAERHSSRPPTATFSKGTLPAKKANTYYLRRAKGKQKSLWLAENQRHDRRKTSEKGQHLLPAASQRETEKPLARREPKA